MNKKPLVLLILDGFGIGDGGAGDAIAAAKTPVLDRLFAENPTTRLSASGEDVGLPAGQMGNSEVGHTNIGAGRIVFQDLPRISRAVRDGSFFENAEYRAAMSDARGGRLHLCGLLSDGGVHSHIDHLFALLDMAKREGVENVCVHAFLDGRDVSPTSGLGFVKRLEEKCDALGNACIATVSGRFYAMDRDKRWDRVQKAYDAMVRGRGERCAGASEYVEKSYELGVTDEFVVPCVVSEKGTVRKGDSVIFFNFRPDRARELTWALTGNLPQDAELETEELKLHYVCTTQYDETLELPIAFPPEKIEMTLGEYISSLGLRQLRIAETEKYAHVTFFFNGGVEKVFPGEDRVLVPSPKQFPTYDLIPEMSAKAVAEQCCEKIRSGAYEVVICNLANCDMVGHTGVFDAAVKAVETVDECAGEIVAASLEAGGRVLITADHGNAERMKNPDGSVCTAHTTNPVPLCLVGEKAALSEGRLSDIAPTMLRLMGFEKPAEMTGNSLIK